MTAQGAHPRSRGENEAARQPHGWETGSSPLTRGKPYNMPRPAQEQRLIPAHAGKTRTASGPPRPPSAHPRSRGENDPGSTQPERLMGSSPLTRGKHARGSCAAADPGLIPAHAGKTFKPVDRVCAYWAHPRSRGENSLVIRLHAQGRGSSPLTRGKLVHHGHDGFRPRLIPAHAGKTGAMTAHTLPTQAHPRSRGENCLITAATVISWGSSPLTRGKRRAVSRREYGPGLIPAHAGKTITFDEAAIPALAHPRSRGENDGGIWNAVKGGGSSPLTRGKQRC